jgi:hypothetical protein
VVKVHVPHDQARPTAAPTTSSAVGVRWLPREQGAVPRRAGHEQLPVDFAAARWRRSTERGLCARAWPGSNESTRRRTGSSISWVSTRGPGGPGREMDNPLAICSGRSRSSRCAAPPAPRRARCRVKIKPPDLPRHWPGTVYANEAWRARAAPGSYRHENNAARARIALARIRPLARGPQSRLADFTCSPAAAGPDGRLLSSALFGHSQLPPRHVSINCCR